MLDALLIVFRELRGNTLHYLFQQHLATAFSNFQIIVWVGKGHINCAMHPAYIYNKDKGLEVALYIGNKAYKMS